MASIQTDPGFEGSAPTWFYLDQTEGTLGRKLPANRTLSSSKQPTLTFTPKFLNAPPNFEGSTNQTKFAGMGKPTAYLKVQLTQDAVQDTATKPLTWAALYPIIDGPGDDIGSSTGTVIFAPASSGDAVVNVPIPGGTATLNVVLTAVVGGPKKNSLGNIIDKVIGLAGTVAGKAIFPIPQADLVLAANVESLLNFASSAFAPDTKQQFWFANVDRPVRLTDDRSNDSALELPSGSIFLVAFQPGVNESIVTTIEGVAAAENRFELDSNGALVARKNGAILNPNPFQNFLYVTFNVIVK